LPDADYDGVVEESVTRAIKRYASRQILIGPGGTGKFCGIFYNPTDADDDIIDRNTDIVVSEIDDTTLDEIIYSFGGEEDVEDTAVLILNKKDLKKFAKLRDKQGRKVYTIVNHGNTGTIDEVPFIINSACNEVSTAAADADKYTMAYGPLSNYEVAVFSDIDARKSTEYKFKQGQIAYRASVFMGGNVVAKNGFIRVKNKATA
jgi:HK97 family phage major capsid protein